MEIANLLTAIHNKFANSNLAEDVGGRYYQDIAPLGTGTPYCVYSIVSSVMDKTFSEVYTNALIQFDLFCSTAYASLMPTMYAHLKALFDECGLSITGSTLVVMRETNLVTLAESLDEPLPDGSTGMLHWAVDYEAMTSLN